MKSYNQRQAGKALKTAIAEHGEGSEQAIAAQAAIDNPPARKTYKELLAEREAASAPKQAARDAKRAALHTRIDEAQARQAADTVLTALGVRITNGTVTSIWKRQELGPLAGATAQVVGEVRKHRVAGGLAAGALVGPAGLLVGATTKGSATVMIAFPDGSTHSHRVDKTAIPAAQRQVVQFAAAAAAARQQEG